MTTVVFVEWTWQDIMSAMVDDALAHTAFSRLDSDESCDYYALEAEHGYSLEDVAETMWALGNCVMACREDA